LGQVKQIKITILIVCLIVVSVFVYMQPSSKIVKKEISLNNVLYNINGWRGGSPVSLDKRIVGMLQLDDYVNRHYFKGDKKVMLYIGYYLSSNKLGVVHDPLVCYPGQGWRISQSDTKKLRIEEHDVHLTRMIVKKGNQSQLVLYWFQVFDKTSPDTFRQKLYSLFVKFLNGREDNAFVRVIVPVEERSIHEASRIGVEFVEELFPRFLEYVKENSETNE